MAERSEDTGGNEARRMLDLYASVGATSFDVTWTDTNADKQRFRRGVPLADLWRALPRILDDAARRQHNVIVRPDGPARTFIQLDDLDAAQIARVAPPVFLTLETSPGSFQAWLALAGRVEDGFARRLKNGSGADVNASGATRIAGSRNFKPKYAPDFPRVTIHQAQPGRITNADELDRLGLVAAAEITPDLPPFRAAPARSSTGGSRKWPSYAICLDRAPLNNGQDGPDTSRADLAFCMTAITWGWSVEDTARRLMEEPESKAHRRGEKYTMDTARKAALFVKQRQQPPRTRRIADHGRR